MFCATKHHAQWLLKTVSICLVIALAISSTPLSALAQDNEDGIQRWTGVLDVGVTTLRLNFEITEKDDGTFSGKFISVDQNNAEVKLTKIEFSDDEVLIEAGSAQAVYKGKLNNSMDEIKGTWSQLGTDYDFDLKRVETFAEPKHVESWKGRLEAVGQEFEFQVRIFEEDDGSRSAKLDSFSENLLGLPIELNQKEDGFDFEVKISKAKFEGEYNDDKSMVEGKWIQGGGEFPLAFEKVEVEETRNNGDRERPQNPKEPFPYEVEEVAYDNPDANLTLAGTLTLPKGDGPFPAMILISGSGPQDRDETIFDHKPFWVIADRLTRSGIAVLRYDERGVGESTGKFAGSTSEDFASDVVAGINFLKTQDRIDDSKIGLIGHSEGGMVAPMIAAERDDIALIVLLAGPGVDGGIIGSSQSKAIAEAAGASEVVVNAQDQLLTSLFDEVRKNGKADDEFVDNLVVEFSEALADQPGADDTVKALKSGLARLQSPWFVYFVQHDPAIPLQKVRCPVLALNGTKDLQVLVDLNIDAIEKALAEGGNEDFEVHKLENLNHLFQTCETGQVSEYGQIEETFAPEVLELMTNWITERVK